MSKYYTIPRSTSATGDLTIDAWIKPDPNNYSNSNVMTLVDQRSTLRPSVWLGYSLYLYNGKLGFYLAQGGGSGPCLPPPRTSRVRTTARPTSWPPGSGITSPSRWIGTTRRRRQVLCGRHPGRCLRSDGPAGLADELRPAPAGQPLILLPSGLYRGILDEVELFPRALTADEIKGIFLAGSSGKASPRSCPASEMVPVPAGPFQMGCDARTTAVTVHWASCLG